MICLDELLEDYLDDNIDADILLTSSSSDTTTSEDGDDQQGGHNKANEFLSIIHQYSETDFKSLFRLKRSTALYLIDLYKSSRTEIYRSGRPLVSCELSVYIYLWYMANTLTYRQLSSLFGITKSTAWKCTNEVAAFLFQNLGNHIKWYASKAEFRQAAQDFEALKGIPNIIGAIDGTHIKIKAPKQNSSAYLNSKKYYSLRLQLIVDSNKKIIHVQCGDPGSIRNAKMLRKGLFYRKVEESPNSWFPNGTFLIGDSTYPCKNWLVTPFKDNGALTGAQTKFNKIHSATRIVVENAIDLLKKRFRRLLHFEQQNLKNVTMIVLSACVLHNLCIMQHDELDDDVQIDVNPDDNSQRNVNINFEDRRQSLINELVAKNIL